MSFGFGGGYQPPDEETPAEKMAREAREWEEYDQAAVEKLLASLKPWDAHRTLFTFEEITQWNLRRRKNPLR